MNTWYNKTKERIGNNDIDLGTLNDLRIVALSTGDYTFDQAHEFLDDIPNGARVATGSISNDTFGAIGDAILDGDDVTFVSPTAGEEIFAFVVYDDSGVESTSPLFCFIDESSDLPITTVVGRDLIVTFNSSGVAKL